MSTHFQTDDNTEYGGYSELLAIEENLHAYNADVVSKMARYFQGKQSVLEFGAGIGTLAMEWRKQTGVKPECLEIDAKQQQIIVDRGFICYRSTSSVPKTFDGVYSSNVLEHIEDDVSVLRDVHGLMDDGAVLAIYVPAFMCLFSEIDRSVGHYRRYHKADLVRKVTDAGFRLVDCYYVDSIGFLAWYASKLFQNRPGANLSSSGSLRLYDRWIYPVSRTLDGLLMRRVAGKNLMLIARKK